MSAFALCLTLFLGGCAKDDPNGFTPVHRLAMRIAVSELISNDLERAQGTLSYINDLRQYIKVDGEIELDGFLQKALRNLELTEMSPATRAAATEVLGMYGFHLKRLSGDQLPTLRISEVLQIAEEEAQWVIGQ